MAQHSVRMQADLRASFSNRQKHPCVTILGTLKHWLQVMSIDTLGTYNTIKATIEEVKRAKGAVSSSFHLASRLANRSNSRAASLEYIATSATLHYKGTFLQAHVSAAKVQSLKPCAHRVGRSCTSSSSKAAIDALFRVAAVEYGPFGVRFNVLSPTPEYSCLP